MEGRAPSSSARPVPPHGDGQRPWRFPGRPGTSWPAASRPPSFPWWLRLRKRKLRGHWRLGVLHRPAPQQPSRSRSPTNRLADRVASPTSASASLRLRVPSRRPRARCRYPCPLHSAPASLVAEPATRAARGPVPRRTVPRLAALARPPARSHFGHLALRPCPAPPARTERSHYCCCRGRLAAAARYLPTPVAVDGLVRHASVRRPRHPAFHEEEAAAVSVVVPLLLTTAY